MKVVATTTQIADIARSVGGEDLEVVQLLQPNSDPHDYEPRPSDLRRASDAELLLTSGDGLDSWAGDIAEQVGLGDQLVDLGAGRPVVLPAAEGDGTDPHWWHDPRNVEHAIDVLRKALDRVAPDRAAAFDAQAARYRQRVRALDAAIKACMARVPADERLLVSDHDAFGYLVERYDITFVGAVIPATTTQAQASAGELAALARTIKERDVRVVFPESALNPRLATAIARRTGAEVGGTLYADTLGPAGSAGETYIGSERANADALVRGFTSGRVGCSEEGS